MPSWTAIAAMAENRVIGDGPKIPWHLPEDFKWFKQTTLGHVLVMGRKTFESIGKPLPDRTTLVLSRATFHAPGVQVVRSLDDVEEAALERKVFICGGAEVYLQALPRCADLLLTRVKLTPPGNVFFPAFEEIFRLDKVLRESPQFDIEHWKHR